MKIRSIKNSLRVKFILLRVLKRPNNFNFNEFLPKIPISLFQLFYFYAKIRIFSLRDIWAIINVWRQFSC